MWIDVENSRQKVYTVDKIRAEKVDKKEKKEPKKRIIYLLFKKFTFIRSLLTNECFTYKLILFFFAYVARKGLFPDWILPNFPDAGQAEGRRIDRSRTVAEADGIF